MIASEAPGLRCPAPESLPAYAVDLTDLANANNYVELHRGGRVKLAVAAARGAWPGLNGLAGIQVFGISVLIESDDTVGDHRARSKTSSGQVFFRVADERLLQRVEVGKNGRRKNQAETGQEVVRREGNATAEVCDRPIQPRPAVQISGPVSRC